MSTTTINTDQAAAIEAALRRVVAHEPLVSFRDPAMSELLAAITSASADRLALARVGGVALSLLLQAHVASMHAERALALMPGRPLQ